MRTIAAHAHVLALTERDGGTPPDQWCHDLTDGSLSWRFSSGANTYTWDAVAIEAFPVEQDGEFASARARELLERWGAIRAMLDHLDRGDPDRLYVDHIKDEMTLVWEASKLIVVIGPEGADELARP